MADSVVINIKADLRAIDRDLKVMHPRLVRQAQVAAINATLVTIRSRGVSGVAKSARIKPQKLIRKRSFIGRAKFKRLEGHVAILLNPMPAQAMRPTGGKRAEVKAGEHTFPKGFRGIARKGKSKGRPSVWKRLGGASYPIQKETVELASKASILGKVGDRVLAQNLKKNLDQALAFRLKKFGGTL